jgi:hypothetical protein
MATASPIDSGMAGGEKRKQGLQSGDRKGDRARAERLRQALRENLKRRKSQAKGRSMSRSREEGGGAPHDSAGIVPEIVPDKPKG